MYFILLKFLVITGSLTHYSRKKKKKGFFADSPNDGLRIFLQFYNSQVNHYKHFTTVINYLKQKVCMKKSAPLSLFTVL